MICINLHKLTKLNHLRKQIWKSIHGAGHHWDNLIGQVTCHGQIPIE